MIWPYRLHQLAGGSVGGELAWWRIVGRDAAVFPEVVAVAGALLEPAPTELAWRASGGTRPRVRGGDDPLCHRLGERVDRNWLGPLAAADYGGPLSGWRGAIVRARRGGGPPGWRDDPWHLKLEQQPETMAGQLRVMAAEAQAGGSGTRWLASLVQAVLTLHLASPKRRLRSPPHRRFQQAAPGPRRRRRHPLQTRQRRPTDSFP
ncbi:hypothetical protein [Streptomyces sp. NBC_00829]|uniref:hypothetical protein n=1 Tax=Streptomyces sp. NBC_00829 TaxID=2903679 RepID=UPI003866F865|nr:hypothetical protein OG293_33200 [Streptomyces sp. NBC_00829]